MKQKCRGKLTGKATKETRATIEKRNAKPYETEAVKTFESMGFKIARGKTV